MTTEQAAEALNVSSNQIRVLLKKTWELRAIAVGGRDMRRIGVSGCVRKEQI